jgi:hypothetical protein
MSLLTSPPPPPSPGVPVADDELVAFVGALFGEPLRSQLWVAYFDDDDGVIPVLTPVDDLPAGSPPGAVEPLAAFVVETAGVVGAAAVALVWERPDLDGPTRDVLTQAGACSAALERDGLLVRARLLLHAAGLEELG